MDQHVIDLYDEYTHSTMPRRIFLDRLVRLVGSAAVASAVLPFLENNNAQAAVIADNDERLQAGYIQYPGATGDIRAYMAQPVKADAPQAVIVVIHENKGLRPHIEDITRRLALAGYIVLAPDALSPLGGTPEDMEKAKSMIATLDPAQTLANYEAAFAYLQQQPETSGKRGCIGFCWGGGLANQLAIDEPSLDAAVVYYGMQPDLAKVKNIDAAVLLQYAGLDQRIDQGKDAYEKALKAANVRYEQYVYDGVNHAFNNDTNAARYNKAAADLAWQRTLAFFTKYLSSNAKA